MSLTNKMARSCSRQYGDDFSELSMAARVEEYEEMLFRGLQPDLDSLLAGLSDKERHEVLLEFALVNAILTAARSPGETNVPDD